jgi:predicted Zn finger-like uncharacterized protein
MLIVCPDCATSYDIKAASLPPEGRRVRCVRCRTVWQVGPSQANMLLAAAEALAPEARAAELPAGPAAAELAPTFAEGGAQPARETSQSPETAADRHGQAPAADGSKDPGEKSGEPVAVDAPPIAPADPDDGQGVIDVIAEPDAEEANALQDDTETKPRRRRRGAVRSGWRWSMSRLQTGILVLLILDGILVGWRKDVVRVLPQTASFYDLIGLSVNLRGLTFESVTTRSEENEGVPILVVEGNIVNETGKTADVPRLKMAVRNAVKQEIYSWTAAPPRVTLSPGETVTFRVRLSSPPPESRDVLVRFVNRHDIVAATH